MLERLLAAENTVPLLQIQVLASLINADLADDSTKCEPKKVIVKTCAYLI